MPTEMQSEREGTGSGANDALIQELVTMYSPAVPERPGSDARKRTDAVSVAICHIVKEVVDEARSQPGQVTVQPPARTEAYPCTNSPDQASVPSRTEPEVEPTGEDRIHDELWRRLVRVQFSYADYVSSNRFQAHLSQVQRKVGQSLARADYDELDSAVLDILRESLTERGESRPPHPFRDFSRFRTEREWWHYFYRAAARRYIRNMKKRVQVCGLMDDNGLADPAENPDVERSSLERRLAMQEIDNLPATFTNTQRDILKHILQGHPLDQSRHYSEGYIRKILRKAISYFQIRG